MFNKVLSKLKHLTTTTQKGYKMTNIHYYAGTGMSGRTGIKVSVIGANASVGGRIIDSFLLNGCPTVMAHRRPIDVFSPTGDDPMLTKSNPYNSMTPYLLNMDIINEVTSY
jgi:hypothetical protein